MDTTHNINTSHMRLYNQENERLYLNAEERARFIDAANDQPAHIRIFCLTLLYTGCRLSEARELGTRSLQAGEQRIAVRSLKKRDQHHIREIPIPPALCQSLSERAKHLGHRQNQNNTAWLWQSADGDMIDRITAYRWVKTVMAAAHITGPQACPKGLRHAYAIHAIRCGIQLNMLQKWMGHADIETTAIYANAVGAEELEIAGRMW
jgi:site-specific recombinase XerD